MSGLSDDFFLERLTELLRHLVEHICLTGIAVAVAAFVGIPLGIWLYRHPAHRGWTLALANLIQTVPSLALLAFLLPFFGIGFKTAIVALTLYAILPILQGTLTGLQEVPADVREAGRGIGMSDRQLLLWIELPLALPSLFTGLRLACVWSVGIATISAFIGAGGLGDFITRGLATNNQRLLLLGAIPAALLAITLDWSVGWCQSRLQPWKKSA